LNHSKLKKFVKSFEYNDVVQVLEKNYSLLKETFLNIVGNGNCFPRIGKNAFDDFCKVSGIKDEYTTDIVIGLAFKASNFHEDSSSENQFNISDEP